MLIFIFAATWAICFAASRPSCLEEALRVAGVPANRAAVYEQRALDQGLSVKQVEQGDVASDSPVDRERVRECFADGVSLKSDKCLSYQACSGQGACVLNSTAQGYRCNCSSPEIIGDRCDMQFVPEQCRGNLCMNGATCLPDGKGSTGYQCICASSFTGVHCMTAMTSVELVNDVLVKVMNISHSLDKLGLQVNTGIPHGSSGVVDYRVFSEAVPWVHARDRCRLRGGELASIRSAEEQARATRVRQTVTSHVWIGGSDLTHEGRYVWMDRTAITYNDAWRSGEPNNYGGNEHCIALYGENHLRLKNQWNDIRCSTHLPFLCEYRASP